MTKPGRRDFIKLMGLSVGGFATRSMWPASILPEFPNGENLGRALSEGLRVHTRPTPDSSTVRQLVLDEIIPVLRTVVGSNPYRYNQKWVETLDGYVWSPEIQPVRNKLNVPVDRLSNTSLGQGMWAEVSVPFVDLIQENAPPRAPWLVNRIESGVPPRFFYSQIVWVDQVKTDSDGQVWYRLNEKYGYGDIFWAVAEALRPLTPEEMSPISPDVDDKRILVDVSRQSMSCFEGGREVYFGRVSTGVFIDPSGNKIGSGTPAGKHPIWRKAVSLPLSGGSAAFGWDLPAVGWISLFVGSGVAIHSTYWHDNYGVPTSRGCVNVPPEDAKWVFRWTLPQVPFDPGDVTVNMPGGTVVDVVYG
jgi:hypothetical protein